MNNCNCIKSDVCFRTRMAGMECPYEINKSLFQMTCVNCEYNKVSENGNRPIICLSCIRAFSQWRTKSNPDE